MVEIVEQFLSEDPARWAKLASDVQWRRLQLLLLRAILLELRGADSDGQEPETSVDLGGLGFREVGRCGLDKSLKSGVRFSVQEYRDERVIYAYVVDGVVKYIGVCDNTKTTLKDRMRRYQGMKGQGTNRRVTELIRACLMQGSEVSILAWRPDKTIEFKGLEVDLVKGLENPLIQKVGPEWNTRE